MSEKLILHYHQPDNYPDDSQALVNQLTDIGFLGGKYNKFGKGHFLAGPEFLQYISFIGCSPTLYTKPEEQDKPGFCHIEISDISPEISFLGGDNANRFWCPHCQHKHADTAIIARINPATVWRCPECGDSTPAIKLNFREQGGFGRFYIGIWGIGEGLALPSDQLMNQLTSFTGENWRYFYFKTT